MTVPVDAALEELALRWIGNRKDPSARVEGVVALSNFRSDKNIAILKKLLADPATVQMSESGKPPRKRYPVRSEAHDALTGWQVEHKTPTIEEPAKK